MQLYHATNISERLTSFTAECLAVGDNCVASKQASKQASIVYNREIVRAKARSSLFAVGFIPRPMKVTGLFAFYSSIKL